MIRFLSISPLLSYFLYSSKSSNLILDWILLTQTLAVGFVITKSLQKYINLSREDEDYLDRYKEFKFKFSFHTLNCF